ncbi:NAD(P)H-dependent oxidoreductase [Conservatibacter flavescens]|uniref:NAD(P)-dependent oxidoreductase n=1 Tax=Conservatibacter flavescens TaxID=28161 RepID=A0A2M8S1Y1_9PAST|nr:NAD(P)-dependent oxidoreductase [Conservatibacter flavescens]PJG85137.1 NAD(P)-dependent oxidoreductase [Conservatibacter flavescens]
MLNMNRKLAKLAEEGKAIRTGIVGAGQMGRGMITQMVLMKGMTPAIVADINVESAVNAFKYAGVDDSDIKIVNTLAEANRWIEAGKYVATENIDLVSHADLVQCAIDATGIPDVGAKVATDAMNNKKHCVMLNVETDVVIGPYLKRLADQNGVIYTGSAGDEPGAVMELYDFATAIGMEVKVMGKGKNNKLDYECNPDTVMEEAIRRKMNPKMLCSFKDGTKTMVEMTAMSNATGLIPDVIGGHGVQGTVKDLPDLYRLKSEGGILNRHGVVEYVNGIAPGVFVVVSNQNEEIAYQWRYHSMGPGPLWVLYRPYHLCNLETPLSVAKAVIDNEATIVPKGDLVSECITVAKKDLKAGETIDGIGGYTTHGSIATKQESDAKGYVPYGLVNKNARMLKDAKKGQLITLDMIELDTSTLIYKLRQEQDKIFAK